MDTTKQTGQPDWLTPEQIDTVIVGFPDAFGRLLGKRLTDDPFVRHGVESGMHACNYLMTVDIEMEPLAGFGLARWDQGYGDFHACVDLRTLRRLPWLEGTALVLCDLFHKDGRPVEESSRRVLSRQVDLLAQRGLRALMGSELEFFLFRETYSSARQKGYRELAPAADYLVDYHLLQPARDEDVLRRIRNELTAAGIPIEGSKGEWGKGQHEVNLLYAEALETADRHVLFKLGAKDIAAQQERALTFMAKWAADEAGSSFHLHISLWDASSERNLFWDDARKGGSTPFRQFFGGLMKYSRELSLFFAPTVNSYKRCQPGSWAPTKLVWAHDNRTCGFRVIGRGNSFRVENRMPGADANLYLAIAATLVAGIRGADEELDCGDAYAGNAYTEESLPRLPETLEQAAKLLDGSALAREALGADVVDYYVCAAQMEARAFREAVTDWERSRYFEQL